METQRTTRIDDDMLVIIDDDMAMNQYDRMNAKHKLYYRELASYLQEADGCLQFRLQFLLCPGHLADEVVLHLIQPGLNNAVQ